jgi:FKBP-type peptidyl-prolyl cis-trans isomerase 2
VPPGQIPENSRRVDAVMIATDPAGVKRPVRVQEVRADKIVLDFNHPLAGKKVVFDVKILSVQ